MLSNVKPNKATGPDNLACPLLKEASNEIAPVLTDIFNSSLTFQLEEGPYCSNFWEG